MTVNIPGPLQLYDSGANCILPLGVDLSEYGKGVFHRTADMNKLG